MLTFNLHPKQGKAFLSEATEILYGGAAGGGKSHLFRVAAITWCIAIPGLQVYFFRRTMPELRKNHLQGISGLPAMLQPLIDAGMCWKSGDAFHFSNGSAILMNGCQYENSVYAFQGDEIHVLIIDELTQFTWDMYTFLRGRLRLGGLQIPEKYKGMFPRILTGANPGGVSHNNVKAAFIDSAPEYECHRAPKKEGGMNRQFIPARLEDNPTMLENDPTYEDRLEGLGSPALVRAMRRGDWDIVAGGYFDEIWIENKKHIVVEPFQVPPSWYVDRSFDWGGSTPFSVGWWAESDGSDVVYPDGTKRATLRGDLFRISEWYGWKENEPNVGLKMLAGDIAKGIKRRERALGLRVRPGAADTQIYTTVNGNSIADDMLGVGVAWVEADKDRKQGWQKMLTMMKHSAVLDQPGLYVFETCRHFIRTVPVLQRADNDPDDVKKAGEDHVADEARYRIFTPRQQLHRSKFRGT